MSLQRKCLTASAVTHGLLLLLVFIGSAFVPQQKPPIDGPEFELVNIPLDLVEEPNVMSGNPNAGQPESAPAQKPPSLIPPQPVVPKPEVPVKQPDPIKKPEPKPEPEKVTKQPVKPAPDPEAFDLTKAKTIKTPLKPEKVEKPDAKFDFSQAKRQVIKSAPDNSKAAVPDTRSAEREAQLAKVNQALEGARKALANTGQRVGLSYSDIIGPGGKAQMSYDRAVAEIFEREFQLRPLPSRGNDPVVMVEVTVRRDGTATGHIVKRSGRAQLDRTVQDVLKSVKKVMPFPAEFKSETRTIRINFNLDETNNG